MLVKILQLASKLPNSIQVQRLKSKRFCSDINLPDLSLLLLQCNLLCVNWENVCVKSFEYIWINPLNMLKAKLSGKSAICDYKSGSCCCNDTNYNNLSAFFVLNRHAYQNHIALVKKWVKKNWRIKSR